MGECASEAGVWHDYPFRHHIYFMSLRVEHPEFLQGDLVWRAGEETFSWTRGIISDSYRFSLLIQNISGQGVFSHSYIVMTLRMPANLVIVIT